MCNWSMVGGRTEENRPVFIYEHVQINNLRYRNVQSEGDR